MPSCYAAQTRKYSDRSPGYGQPTYSIKCRFGSRGEDCAEVLNLTLEGEISKGRCPRGWGELCIYPDGTKPTAKDCAQCFKDQGDHSDD